MANTRDIRRRIKSVKNTAQITKAMQMVAASKMRKAQEAALSSRPFAENLDRVLAQVQAAASASGVEDAHPLLAHRQGERVCVLVISTDKGLCGALNTNLLRLISNYSDDTQFVTVGRKGRGFLTRSKRDLLADFEISDGFKYPEARRVSNYVQKLFTDGKVDRVDVLYTYFVNTITQKPTSTQFLPLSPDPVIPSGKLEDDMEAKLEHDKAQIEADACKFLFEPSPTEVLGFLLPQVATFQLWHYILESKASEHSARMVAMKNATDNAKALVKDLTLEYNKVRQAAITNELLEISSAQAALG